MTKTPPKAVVLSLEYPEDTVIIPLETLQDVSDLIKDLQDARRTAKRTRATRRVWRADLAGRKAVFEIKI